MELRHLTAIAAIAETGSISAAATRLGYTQSAVSQQVAAVERELGVRLLTRPGGSRPVEFTEAGRRVAEHAAAVVNRITLLCNDVARFRSGRANLLRVGTIGSTAVHVLPQALRLMHARAPDVEIQLMEERSDEPLLLALEQGRLDVTFAQLPLPPGPFEWRHLLTAQYVLMVRHDQPLTADPDKVLREISRLPLIAYRRVRPAHDIQRHLELLGHKTQVVFRTDDNSTVQRLVGIGFGAAIVPEIALDPADEAIRVVTGIPGLPPFPVAVVWHRDAPPPTDFVECAASVGRTLAARLRREHTTGPVVERDG